MRILRCEEGLTLVETIIALVLMLGLMAAFAGAMTVALQSEVEVDERLEASNLASGIIESLSDISLNGVDLGTYNLNIEDSKITLSFNSDEYEVIIDIDEDLLLDSLNEDTNLEIKPYPDDSDDSGGLYKVTVNISWDDRGNTHELNIITLLAAD